MSIKFGTKATDPITFLEGGKTYTIQGTEVAAIPPATLPTFKVDIKEGTTDVNGKAANELMAKYIKKAEATIHATPIKQDDHLTALTRVEKAISDVLPNAADATEEMIEAANVLGNKLNARTVLEAASTEALTDGKFTADFSSQLKAALAVDPSAENLLTTTAQNANCTGERFHAIADIRASAPKLLEAEKAMRKAHETVANATKLTDITFLPKEGKASDIASALQKELRRIAVASGDPKALQQYLTHADAAQSESVIKLLQTDGISFNNKIGHGAIKTALDTDVFNKIANDRSAIEDNAKNLAKQIVAQQKKLDKGNKKAKDILEGPIGKDGKRSGGLLTEFQEITKGNEEYQGLVYDAVKKDLPKEDLAVFEKASGMKTHMSALAKASGNISSETKTSEKGFFAKAGQFLLGHGDEKLAELEKTKGSALSLFEKTNKLKVGAAVVAAVGAYALSGRKEEPEQKPLLGKYTQMVAANDPAMQLAANGRG